MDDMVDYPSTAQGAAPLDYAANSLAKETEIRERGEPLSRAGNFPSPLFHALEI
jgi:hypothetical protein